MKPRVSELMDGELDDRAADDLIGMLGRGGDAAEAWRTYHLIGDTLRGTRSVADRFGERVAARLAAEPTVLAPGRPRPAGRTWYAMSAAASVAAVALVGWVAFGPQRETVQEAAPVAQAKPAVLPEIALVPVPPEANDYLLAHQVYSPRVSLQGMAPYVRSVASER